MFETVSLGVAASLIALLLAKAFESWRARRSRLTGWYLQAVYKSSDERMERPWSIELVELRQVGRSIRGVMYRVHTSNLDFLWRFHGRVSRDSEINLHYWSLGASEARNGTMRLIWVSADRSRLGGFWSGAMRETPESLHYLAAAAGMVPEAETRRIGADFSKDAPIEWTRADRDADDRVRRWLEVALDEQVADGERTIREVLKDTLPPRAYRVLTEPPPYPSAFALGMEGVMAGNGWPLVGQAGAVARRKASEEARARRRSSAAEPEWVSPTAELLGLGPKDEQEQGGSEPAPPLSPPE